MGRTGAPNDVYAFLKVEPFTTATFMNCCVVESPLRPSLPLSLLLLVLFLCMPLRLSLSLRVSPSTLVSVYLHAFDRSCPNST